MVILDGIDYLLVVHSLKKTGNHYSKVIYFLRNGNSTDSLFSFWIHNYQILRSYILRKATLWQFSPISDRLAVEKHCASSSLRLLSTFKQTSITKQKDKEPETKI